MNKKNCVIEKQEVERIIDRKCKTILSRFFLQKLSNSSNKHSKSTNRKSKRQTIKVNLPIAVKNGFPNIAHSKTSIEDLFVFEYEYGLTPHTLIKNSM